jgi:CheY-like chemotaxis protein
METQEASESTTTVLVVEDDPAVRKLSLEYFNELGYRTIEAEDGPAALRVLDSTERVQLLFTDVVMPNMNGKRLAEEALRRRPKLKVLFTSGYTRNAIVHRGIVDPDVLLLAKPYTLQQLAKKVREVLGS